MAIIKNTGITFQGCTLKVFTREIRAMSDVWVDATVAMVWDGEKVKEVVVNYNFECDTDNGSAFVDATEETLAAVDAWVMAQNNQAQEAAQRAAQQAQTEEMARPTKGRVVEVYKGRKVPVGTVGLVFWTGIDNYGNAKVGIATSNRTAMRPGSRFASFVDVVWTAASNCRALPNQEQALRTFNG